MFCSKNAEECVHFDLLLDMCSWCGLFFFFGLELSFAWAFALYVG
jgi:hypothetical protein